MKKGTKQVNSYVSFGHEVYKNLFSGLLFKLKENEKNIKNYYVSSDDGKNIGNLITKNSELVSSHKYEDDEQFGVENGNDILTNNLINTNNINIIDDPNNYPEFETTEDGSLIFAIEGFDNENILQTANALNKALNKKNDKVDINTFLEIYRLFAEFRWALSCHLKPNLKLSRQNDIYNYHKYSYKTGEEIQTKEFYSEDNDTKKNDITKIEIIKTNDNGNEGNNIELIDKEQNDQMDQIDKVNEIRTKIRNMETGTDSKLSARLNEYRWPWWQIFLWLLCIIPGLIHEIWRRYKIKDLKTVAAVAANEKKKELSSDTNMNTVYKEKAQLELKSRALLINFIIERQLALLQANEVFVKNMILKSNDPKCLKQMESKSINTFLRENNNLVNFENRDDDNNACQKVVPEVRGGMKNTHQISINGKNYFTKKGKLFLDFVIKGSYEKDVEEYRGNLDKENLSGKQNNPLIDTASHGCIMKAFDNFLGLNVLVDTKLIGTPDGYDVFMKSADGENAGDIFWDKAFNLDERCIAFIKGLKDCGYKKQRRFDKLNKSPLSSELQVAIMEINCLDYLCGNRDRYTTNLFVWKNGLHGIDNEYAFFTGTDWNQNAESLCINTDLPNLIPYATQELYEIVKSLIDAKNIDKLIDIYMIFAKTANEENLLQGAKNIRTRAQELYNHFKQLEQGGRILKSAEDFNAKTAIEITEKSLILNDTKKHSIDNDKEKNKAAIGTVTGIGVIGYINGEIQKISGPQPKQENNLFIIQEENEDQDNEYDNGDIF